MRYAHIDKNDIINGEGVCVSLWMQGCPHRCPGCHNPETWDFNSGKEIDFKDLLNSIIHSLETNNINRNLSILGGEPLCKENAEYIARIVDAVKQIYPNKKIFIWTGYELRELINANSIAIREILSNTDVLITGRYIESQRDVSLKWRGSTNQQILYKDIDF